MKLDPNYITHASNGKHYMVTTGNAAFNGIVINNETAALIVETLKKETTESAIVDAVMAKYKADRAEVESDVAEILDKLRSIGALNE